MYKTPAIGLAALSLSCAVFCGSVAAARSHRAHGADHGAQRASPRPPSTAAGPCVSQEVDAGFHSIGSASSACGGMRSSHGSSAWTFPSACLFLDESGSRPGIDGAVFRAIVAEMRSHPTRRYAVTVYARETAGAGAAETTRTRAQTLVDRLVAAGLDRSRFTSRGAGTTIAEEIYDGPSTLAPGNALVEIALLRAPSDAANCPP